VVGQTLLPEAEFRGMAKTAKTDKRRLGSQLAEKLEEEIISGQMKPGTKLSSETALGQRLHASRASIREALQILKAKGLLISRQGSGSYVARDFQQALGQSIEQYAILMADRDSFLEMLDLRLQLETFCVRRLTIRHSTPPLLALKKCLQEMKKNVRHLARFGQCDIRFHLLIADGSEHALFRNILHALLPTLGMRYARETYKNQTEAEKTLRDHERIFHAIQTGNAKQAETALRAHLMESREHLQHLLANKPYDKKAHKNKTLI
jgi:GntR family transcriptional regulator, transcriptional repressor for pyruvate dehydrogenase complex